MRDEALLIRSRETGVVIRDLLDMLGVVLSRDDTRCAGMTASSHCRTRVVDRDRAEPGLWNLRDTLVLLSILQRQRPKHQESQKPRVTICLRHCSIPFIFQFLVLSYRHDHIASRFSAYFGCSVVVLPASITHPLFISSWALNGRSA